MSEQRAAGWIKTRRELLDAATEGPWFQGRTGRRYESDRDVYSKREPDEENSHDIATYVWSAEDAALITDARTTLPAALNALEAVLRAHYDDGPSQGYFGDPAPYSYGVRAHCCSTCGTHGEYGVEWPCPTVRAIAAALGVEP